MKILLAIDDSKYSKAALEVVAMQHPPRGTEVLVLHVILPVATIVPPDLALASPTDWEKLRKRHIRSAQKLTRKAMEKLCAAGFHAESLVIEGNPRSEIVDRAAAFHADLIVIGSHGLTGLSRLLLGSVSEFVVRHAPCSVQVVRLPHSETAR